MANLIFMKIVDRAGRRTFFIVSSFATTIGLAIFAVYLKYFSSDARYDWILVACLSSVLLVGFLGMIPTPYIVAVELLPEKVGAELMFDHLWRSSNVSRIFLDQKLQSLGWRFHDACHAIYPVRNLSDGKRANWSVGMDHIFQCDVLMQCYVRHFLFARDEREIL